jgi:hypothetical protein
MNEKIFLQSVTPLDKHYPIKEKTIWAYNITQSICIPRKTVCYFILSKYIFFFTDAAKVLTYGSFINIKYLSKLFLLFKCCFQKVTVAYHCKNSQGSDNLWSKELVSRPQWYSTKLILYLLYLEISNVYV